MTDPPVALQTKGPSRASHATDIGAWEDNEQPFRELLGDVLGPLEGAQATKIVRNLAREPVPAPHLVTHW